MRSSRDVATTAELARSDRPADVAELQWRLSVPFMCAVLALAAVPLARLRPRQGRYARIGAALLLVFVYLNLIGAGRSMIAGGRLPPWPGMLWVHILMVAGLLLWFLGPALRRSLRRATATAVPA